MTCNIFNKNTANDNYIIKMSKKISSYNAILYVVDKKNIIKRIKANKYYYFNEMNDTYCVNINGKHYNLLNNLDREN